MSVDTWTLSRSWSIYYYIILLSPGTTIQHNYHTNRTLLFYHLSPQPRRRPGPTLGRRISKIPSKRPYWCTHLRMRGRRDGLTWLQVSVYRCMYVYIGVYVCVYVSECVYEREERWTNVAAGECVCVCHLIQAITLGICVYVYYWVLHYKALAFYYHPSHS